MPNTIRYLFSLKNALQNFVDITVSFPVKASTVVIKLPAWRPGRYELGNFSKNIRNLRAYDEKEALLQTKKIDRNTWEISNIQGRKIQIHYEYYANELNAGSTFTDGTFLYVNPVNCALYTEETSQLNCIVELDIPKTWEIAGVSCIQRKFSCENFDKLSDSPFIASPDLSKNHFKIGKVEFTIWFHRQLNIPWKKVISDFSIFSTHLINEFGNFPTNRFEFIVLSLPYTAYHGVEHLESTIITLGPSYDIFSTLYNELLGVSCHELYHVWNVKTIRPEEIFPYDFSKENYSQLGFIYEGITTYFGDLYLLKSGVFNLNQYLIELGEQFQKHADNFGRLNYSLADSSIDTWVDGYSSGIPNRKVSIYTEGCLLALWLDHKILTATDNSCNLQSVMTLLYRNFGVKKKGISLNIFISTLQEIAGDSFIEEFKFYITNPTDFIPILTSTLNGLGLELLVQEGNASEKHLGIKGVNSLNGYLITHVHPNGTAQKIGLNVNDEILSINGNKLKGDLNQWLLYYNNFEINLNVQRNGMILVFKISRFSKNGFDKYSIQRQNSITSEQENRFNSWSGISKEKSLF